LTGNSDNNKKKTLDGRNQPGMKMSTFLKNKVQVKIPCVFLTEHHAMKAYWGLEV
jgi:hypothetical protein